MSHHSEGARWIPKGMSVGYLAQARTSIQEIADGSPTDWETAGDKVVPVHIFDEGGVKVFTARITMNVTWTKQLQLFAETPIIDAPRRRGDLDRGPAISAKDFAKSQKRKSPE